MIHLPLEQIIPCSLHIMMNVTLKLFVLLLRNTWANDELSHEWEMLLGSECNINVLGDEGTPLYQLVKGKTISRPQALAILDKYKLFINGLQWWPDVPLKYPLSWSSMSCPLRH